MEYLTKENYESKVKENTCVVVFSAPWCRDCIAIKPMLDKLEVEFSGKIMFFGVDFDTQDSLKDELNIRRIPTLIFYKNSQEYGQRLVEPNSLETIRKVLQAIL